MSAKFASAAAAAVIAFWLINFYLGSQVFDVSRSGLFGDMFGAINSAFSGFALVGIVYGIVVQNKQLAIAQNEAQEEKSLRYQTALEGTFYNLLNLFSENTSNMDLLTVADKTTIARGKDCFKFFVDDIKAIIKDSNENNIEDADHLENTYGIFYGRRRGDLGHYYRSMYNILKYIDSSPVNNKKFYSNILRAQLSDYEVVVLFFNGLSRGGYEKMKPFIEKYCLLKHLPLDELPVELKSKIQKLRPLYKESAFGLHSHNGSEASLGTV